MNPLESQGGASLDILGTTALYQLNKQTQALSVKKKEKKSNILTYSKKNIRIQK